MPAERAAMKGVAVSLLLVLLGAGLGAQERPEPIFALRPSPVAASWTLDVHVPPGWSLYAADPGALGLPLTARWTGERGRGEVVPVQEPSPLKETYPWGAALVHRGHVRVSVPAPITPGDTLSLEWALCRPDLCVPGRTRVPATEGAADGGRR